MVRQFSQTPAGALDGWLTTLPQVGMALRDNPILTTCWSPRPGPWSGAASPCSWTPTPPRGPRPARHHRRARDTGPPDRRGLSRRRGPGRGGRRVPVRRARTPASDRGSRVGGDLAGRGWEAAARAGETAAYARGAARGGVSTGRRRTLDDWSLPPLTGCACEHCARLNAFLTGPWPAHTGDRNGGTESHAPGGADQARRAPVSHDAATGAPALHLVLTKTMAVSSARSTSGARTS